MMKWSHHHHHHFHCILGHYRRHHRLHRSLVSQDHQVQIIAVEAGEEAVERQGMEEVEEEGEAGGSRGEQEPREEVEEAGERWKKQGERK